VSDPRADAICAAAQERGFEARWAVGDLPPFVIERVLIAAYSYACGRYVECEP
jgi:hypothetical protein